MTFEIRTHIFNDYWSPIGCRVDAWMFIFFINLSSCHTFSLCANIARSRRNGKIRFRLFLVSPIHSFGSLIILRRTFQRLSRLFLSILKSFSSEKKDDNFSIFCLVVDELANLLCRLLARAADVWAKILKVSIVCEKKNFSQIWSSSTLSKVQISMYTHQQFLS